VHRVERVDDIPVLLATSKVLKVDAIPDRHFPTGHRWLGALTFGEVACVWVALFCPFASFASGSNMADYRSTVSSIGTSSRRKRHCPPLSSQT